MGGYSKAEQYLGDHCSPFIETDPRFLFPVATIEVKGYHARHQNLRKLRSCAGMKEEDLRTNFDGIAHVIAIKFLQRNIAIDCCWSAVADDRHLEFFSKPVALMSSEEGIDAFHIIAHKICNAVDWVTEDNKQWIRDDLKKLQLLVPSLPPLEPRESVSGSGRDSEVSE